MKNIILFITHGTEIYEMSAFADVFSWNNAYGSEKINVDVVGYHKVVRCTGKINVKVEKFIEDINFKNYQALAIPGGYAKEGFLEDVYRDSFLSLINEFDRVNKPIASVCVGALPIARSGVLENRKATTYKGRRQNELKELNVIVKNKKLVKDKNIITSQDPSTAIDVALKLLEMLTSVENSDNVRRLMGF